MAPTYKTHKRISLRNHPAFNEKWLQNLIAEDPAMLGLGDLEFKYAERRQPRAGRLDLLLESSDGDQWYEVEIQLGETDETHIIRTIEYWDIERRRHPELEHCAVVVAEDITSRFLNVISLFNGFIPLIAVQITAVEIDGSLTLVATTVLDKSTLGTDEAYERQDPTVREFWEKKKGNEPMKLVDEIFGSVLEIDPEIELTFRKQFIGLARNGIANHYITFCPRRGWLLVRFKIPRSQELAESLEETGLDGVSWDTRGRRCRVHLHPGDVEKHRNTLVDLIEKAREHGGR